MLFSSKGTFSSLPCLLRLEGALLVCFAVVCFLFSRVELCLTTKHALIVLRLFVMAVITPAWLTQQTGTLMLGSMEAHTTFMGFFSLPPSCLEQLSFCPKILRAYSLRHRIQQSTFSFGISRLKHSLSIKQVGECPARCSLAAQQPLTLLPLSLCRFGSGRAGRL